MSSRIGISTYDGYSAREVVYGETTSLDLHVQVDGAAATITGAVCKAFVPGTSTPVTLTVTNAQTGASITPTATASETVLASFPDSARSTLGATLWQRLTLRWTITLLLDTVSTVRHWPEDIYISDQIPMPALSLARITSAYPELNSSRSLPTGWTTWWPMVQRAYRELRNYAPLLGPDRMTILLRNHQAYSEPLFHWTLLDISSYQAQRVGDDGTGDWSKRVKYHETERDRLIKSIIATYADQMPINPTTAAPMTDIKTGQRPFGFPLGSNRSQGAF